MSQINNKNIRIIGFNSFFLLFLIICIGITIRLIFLPYNIPITLDSFYYFTYSLAITEQGYFPEQYLNVNFGWPSFLSVFFMFVNNFNMIDTMLVQRILASIISVLTIIPVYFLLKRFFSRNISILGASIFCFEPHLIMNSVVGDTMPLFIFLVTCSIYFSLLKKTRYYAISFIFISLASFVRYEGFLLFVPLIVSIFLEKNLPSEKIKNLILSVSIGVLILIPILFVGYDSEESLCDDCMPVDLFNNIPIISHIFGVTPVIIANMNEGDIPNNDEIDMETKIDDRWKIYFSNSIFSFSKVSIFLLLPTLIIFLIPAIFFITKKITRDRIILLIYGLMIILPAWYAYSRGMEDVRYLFPLISIIILFSCVSIKRFYSEDNAKKIGVGIVTVFVIISLGYIVFQIEDYQEKRDIYESALFVAENAEGVNLEPGGRFMKIAEMETNWKEFPKVDERNKIFVSTKRISLEEYQNIEKFIEESKTKGLTHIVVYNENQKDFLTDIYHNENKYHYLLKVYDSYKLDHKKQIKIFEIDYAKFQKVS